MANIIRKGFRWVGNKLAPSATEPPILIFPVADNYGTKINRGDPVKLVSTGMLEQADTNANIFGVCDGVKAYYDGSFMRGGVALPANTTYGSVIQRQSLLRVIPVRGQLFEATCDEATTATTLAAYLAFVGENVDFALGTAANGESGVVLDISTHVTTAEDCRILNVPDRELQDFASVGVRLVIEFNLIQDATASTTGT